MIEVVRQWWGDRNKEKEIGKLVRNIKDGHLRFDSLPSGLVREYPPEDYERILVRALGEEGVDFPKANELGRFIAKLMRFPWFLPNQEPNKELLQQRVDIYFAAFSLKPQPVRITEDLSEVEAVSHWRGPAKPAWFEAEMTARRKCRELADATRLRYEFFTVGDLARDAVNSATYMRLQHNVHDRQDPRNSLIFSAAEDAIHMAQWLVVEDAMPYSGYPTNPYEPVMGIYEQGFFPVRGAEECVIFVPQRAA